MHYPKTQGQIINTRTMSFERRDNEKISLPTAFNVKFTASYSGIIHWFYLRYLNKPKMLEDILPLADKSSLGVRGNATVWSRSVTSSVLATNSVSYYEKFHLHNYTQNQITHKFPVPTTTRHGSQELTLMQHTHSFVLWAGNVTAHGPRCIPAVDTPQHEFSR